VELDDPKLSYALGQFENCFYVATKEEWTADGQIVLDGSGSYAWYLHEDLELHMSAYEDDSDGNITSTGYFQTLGDAEEAIKMYNAKWGATRPQDMPKKIKSRVLFDD
jgi:hypothetical protein